MGSKKRAYNPDTLVASIEDAFGVQCGRTPILYIKAGISEGLSLFTSLTSPDWKLALELATGASWLHHSSATVHEATEGTRIADNALTKTAFSLGAVADQLTWWMWIAGVVSEGITSFTSQVYKMNNCASQPYTSYNDSSSAIGGTRGGGDYYTGFIWNGQHGEFDPTLIVDPGDSYAIAANFIATDVSNVEIPGSCIIVNQANGQRFALDNSHTTPQGEESGSMVWHTAQAQGSSSSTMAWLATSPLTVPHNEVFASSKGANCFTTQWHGSKPYSGVLSGWQAKAKK